MTARRPVRHETRSSRQRRQNWLKVFIWVFLVVFALSVVGIGFISVQTAR